MSQRALFTAFLLGLVVTALFWIGPVFFPLVLLGPPLTGVLAAIRQQPLVWPVLVWFVAGVGVVISDWLVNQEDVGFHIVLTVFVSGLAALARAVTREFTRGPASAEG